MIVRFVLCLVAWIPFQLMAIDQLPEKKQTEHTTHSKKLNQSSLKQEGLFAIKKATNKELESSKLVVPFYLLKSCNQDEKRVSLDDGSVWDIASSSCKTLSHWAQETPIVVSVNYTWFSPYAYWLHNITLDEYVQANFALNSSKELSICIKDIDLRQGIITVSTGSKWRILPSLVNRMELSKWFVGQPILLGENTEITSDEYPCVFINIQRNTYIVVQKMKVK